MKKFLFLVLAFIASQQTRASAFAEGGEYAVTNIPPPLAKDADAVVRRKTTRWEVKNKSDAVEKVLIAVTVFNSKERDNGQLVLWYDTFRKITSFEARIFDAEGNEVKELDGDQIRDYGAFDGMSLATDNRVKAATLYHEKYPYTVEWKYEIRYSGYLQWPSWYSRESVNPVELSRFEVVLSDKEELRYWCNNDSVKPEVFPGYDTKLYIWEAKDLGKLSKDAYGDDNEDYATVVHIAPAEFELDDNPGRMTTWNEFGSWMYALYKEQGALPEDAKASVRAMTDKLPSTREKIKKLYQYMQDRTRYISIQLGIGGWKPFSAAYVHERGYGDCKAATNYMIALLQEAGIPAYPALIRSGDFRYPFIYSFPSNQFNHVMAVVPDGNDTVWLECTNQKIPAGHVSSTIENRCALLLSANGGTVIRAPLSVPALNTTTRVAAVNLNAGGAGRAVVHVQWAGRNQMSVRSELADETPEDRLKWLEDFLDIPNIRVESYTFSGIDNRDTGVSLSSIVMLTRYANVSGNRIFLNPNLAARQTYVPADVAVRYSPIRMQHPYRSDDTVLYSMPMGYAVETLPKDVSFSAPFGTFRATTKMQGDSLLIYTRTKEISTYEIPTGSYTEYRKFCAEIVKADRAQAVLVKKKE